MNKQSWFDNYGNILKDIPAECVEDCASSGDVSSAVEYWIGKLGFEVPTELAIAYLKEFGAWDDAELAEMSQHDLAMKVLWIACGDISERGEWFGLVH